MSAYFLRRFLLLIPTFFGITFLVFTITRFVPGGPIDQMMMQMAAQSGEVASGGGNAQSMVEIPEQAMEALKAHYHLDQPFFVAYAYWLADLVRLDLGDSYKYNEPVIGLIVARFPISIYFGLTGFLLAYLVCIPLGILKAIHHGSPFDFASSVLVFIGYSIPGWALGAVLLVLFGGGSFWDIFPLGGFRSEGWADFPLHKKILDQLHHTILPVISYSVGSFATLTVLMKNSLMENLGADYVRTAFAKGLTERQVIVGHALRNSLIPIATGLGSAIGLVMAGSYLIEVVFNIDGIGYLGYTSIVGRDYAVVMGILVINTLLILVGNILSDVLYVLIDPRIRFT
ncbi:MAG: ABC transporter permease subunit [Deltaproteobacteria bacterium]|nr:MAG: ABC transporter permease subunit [Deltaproteobacteria bacterium]